MVTMGVGVNGSRIKFFSRITYVPKPKSWETSVLKGEESAFQQQKQDPNKITKPAEEEWDQSDLRLASYDQNNHQTLLLKLSGRHACHWTGKGVYIRST
jgi:hypothetical protein